MNRPIDTPCAFDSILARRSDVAARCPDVDRISHVINYDMAIDTESYVHRIGRTGRAGRSGAVISFVTPRERRLLGQIERATRQPMVEMRMPSVEDVNVTRLTRFDDAITEALADENQLNQYRDFIAHYVNHHDVLETDVAAALAIVAQGEAPLLLSPDDPRFARQRDERESRAPRGDRDDRGSREFGGSSSSRPPRPEREDRPERRPRDPSRKLVPYRIEVGKRHRVEPRQIVGALANEGGFSRQDFGHIDIRPDFSIVELPANIGREVFDKLAATRISGKLIEIKPDRAPRRDDRPPRKPRY